MMKQENQPQKPDSKAGKKPLILGKSSLGNGVLKTESKDKIQKKRRKKRHLPLPQFGKNLVAVRKQLGFTQEKLGEEMGISINTISRMENNKGQPTFYLLYRLWDQYLVNPMSLLKGEEPLFLEEQKNSNSNIKGGKQ